MKTYRITYTPRAFGPFADAAKEFANLNDALDRDITVESRDCAVGMLVACMQPAVIEHYQAKVVEVQEGANAE